MLGKDYHVGYAKECSNNIIAGLHSDDNKGWLAGSCICTQEAIEAVRDYMLDHIEKDRNSFQYEWADADNVVQLKISNKTKQYWKNVDDFAEYPACGYSTDYDYDYITNNGMGNCDYKYCSHCGARLYPVKEG